MAFCPQNPQFVMVYTKTAHELHTERLVAALSRGGLDANDVQAEIQILFSLSFPRSRKPILHALGHNFST
jgi:hypothetical protein